MFSPEITDAMTGAGSDELFSGLKNVLEVAVHISPLALLHGTSYTKLSIDRAVLVQVMHADVCRSHVILTFTIAVGPRSWTQTGLHTGSGGQIVAGGYGHCIG